MNVENPAALRFIMQDDIFLLPEDKATAPAKNTESVLTQMPVAVAPEPDLTAAPIPVIPQPESQPPVAQTPVLPPPPVAQPTVAAESIAQTPQSNFNYLGGNKKQMLVLVNYANEQHIATAHLTALENILKRKELSLDDVAIFNMAGQANADIKALKAFFKPIKLLIMGANAMPGGLSGLPLNQLKQGGGQGVLYSFAFDEMMASNDNKKAFWDQMKNL